MRHRGAGFTLVELLLSVAMLSLVVLALASAMRSFAQIETRMDDLIRRDDELRISGQFLRGLMGTIAWSEPTPQVVAERFEFEGLPDEMRWVGVLPARHGAGGLYRFKLSLRPQPDVRHQVLSLEFTPYVRVTQENLRQAVEARTMASEVMSLSFRYFDGDETDPRWLATWPHADRLPVRIGMTLKTEHATWPEVVSTVIAGIGPRPITMIQPAVVPR